MRPLAIIVLGPAAMPLAERLRAMAPGSRIHGLRSRLGMPAAGCDDLYDDFGTRLRELHAGDAPVLALCAAGIIIRALAPRLTDDDKLQGAAVLAVAQDGSSVVPLLGGLRGANDLARDIALSLDGHAAITTSGELRFGTCLLQPPPGYVLADIEHGKRLVSGLLASDTLRIEGDAPWLDHVDLPRAASATHSLQISASIQTPDASTLRIYPRNLVLACRHDGDTDAAGLADRMRRHLAAAGLAVEALAVVLIGAASRHQQIVAEAARELGASLRRVDSPPLDAETLLRETLPELSPCGEPGPTLALAQADRPVDPARIGRPRGKLSVIGLGPGHAAYMVPAARAALEQATDILGYATYVEMAGPLRPGQRRHPSDNREELQRAAHGFTLAAEGRHVAMVSSGDPGVFAMAAATLEALEAGTDPAWHEVELEILPGVSAALACAAIAGAPLGHDFCLISLSDNLKPWSLIERRLALAAEADLAMGWYNPISRHRPWQLDRALDIVRRHRDGSTPVVLGWNIARPGARLNTVALQDLRSEMVDMRTVVIIGSSTTRRFGHENGREWVYTPRSHPFQKPG